MGTGSELYLQTGRKKTSFDAQEDTTKSYLLGGEPDFIVFEKKDATTFGKVGLALRHWKQKKMAEVPAKERKEKIEWCQGRKKKKPFLFLSSSDDLQSLPNVASAHTHEFRAREKKDETQGKKDDEQSLSAPHALFENAMIQSLILFNLDAIQQFNHFPTKWPFLLNYSIRCINCSTRKRWDFGPPSFHLP